MARTALVAVVISLLVFGEVIQGRNANFINIDHFNSSQFNQLLTALETSHGPALGIVYNRGLDTVLDFVNMETLKQGKSEVSLPDIEEDFNSQVLFVNVSGKIVADHGVLTDLATLRRTGDVTISRDGHNYTVTVHVGLGEVRVRYSHYRAKLIGRGPSVSGSIDGQVGSNAIRATATVTVMDGACSVVLDELRVVQLEGLKVKISGSGFGPLNWLLSTVTSSIAKKNRDEIILKIEEGLTKLATKSLRKIHCDLNLVPLL